MLNSDRERTINIIDVRPPTEFGICSIPGSTSRYLFSCFSCAHWQEPDVPLKVLQAHPQKYLSSHPTVVTCRLGNDSQIAAQALREASASDTTSRGSVVDLIGGLRAWSGVVDGFPVY